MDTNLKPRVVVGLSGGVDSSVAAALLLGRGYDVAGLFMRNWKEKDENGRCTAETDFFDVKRVAAVLGIDYYAADFSEEYWDRVFVAFVEEYKKGGTPNPDVLCNREIKFGPFAERAKKMGADYIATGHYAATEVLDGLTFLKKAKDKSKDQTYFLNQLNQAQLTNVLFPLGGLLKAEVRELAKKYGLAVAEKKDSTGICFIGERKFREFLANYIPSKPGDIVTEDGRVVGRHSGVCYYTVGQRRGLGLGGDSLSQSEGRWFVVKKDVQNNLLYVCRGDDGIIYGKELYCSGFNFITLRPQKNTLRVFARIRHRQPEQAAVAEFDGDRLHLVFDQPQRAIASGQYAVLYDGEYCIGGGVIE
ncbi:MAG: tRNA 2-thiouridine(34) synthase MnmA [Clostridiales bacterium]|jgi:tRNA-specific 2-thiouridylase|nr:tRNA 2-thiouridine(34) synthase MnmA [Clostridiales bacterium]